MSTPERENMTLSDSEMPTPQRREKDTDACCEPGGVQETGVDADMASIMGQRLFDAALSSWDSSSLGSDEESSLSDPPSSTELNDFADEEGFESEDEATPHAPHSPSALVKQQRLKQEETLTPHPTSATKVIATLRIPKPDGSGNFVQVDEIPEVRGTRASGAKLGREGVYFCPPILERKMPGRKRDATAWVLNPTSTSSSSSTTNAADSSITYTSTLPTGATQTFTPTIILRAFSKTNDAYIKAYLNTSLLTSLDPNSHTWSTKYAKWIQQIHSRSDPSYRKKLTRDIWTEAEKAELLACVQDFVKDFGLKALGKKTGAMGAMKDSVFSDWASRINEVSGNVNGRSKDAVRSAFFKANEKKNKGIFELLVRADKARTRGASGADGAGGEREDEGQDHLLQDPSVPNGEQRSRTKVTKTPATGRKRKRPASARAPAHASTINDTIDGDDADAEDQALTTMPKRKKRKIRGQGKGKIPVRSEGFSEKTKLVLKKARILAGDSGDDGEQSEMGEANKGFGKEEMSIREKTEFAMKKVTALMEGDAEDVGMLDA
ncbi:hypothetical protein DDE83_000006 [Stemphylium lycopersici]|uniref:Uncharacterized protein n=1 Tax=Stemphylium lycopersici TaxID=183478 RepID=A0A364NH67_STELY|nr:hypothetical protein DDE83_000006 [Stemphylium lycopersici]